MKKACQYLKGISYVRYSALKRRWGENGGEGVG